MATLFLRPNCLRDVEGKSVSLAQLEGKPTFLIFYLGFGCLHCIEQLHAFSPAAAQFRAAGIDVLAISTESLESLKTGIDRNTKPIEIPLHANPI